MTFTKTLAPGQKGDLRSEAAGLTWLAEAMPAGGVEVARVLRADQRELVEERIITASPSLASAEAYGRALALTHAAGASWFGCPPSGWTGQMSVGRARVPLLTQDPHTSTQEPNHDLASVDIDSASGSWGQFYANYRIQPYVEQAVALGEFTPEDARTFDGVLRRLRDGEFDSPQPRLVREGGHGVSRIHGDLWSGNVMWSDVPTGAVLIDPLAHGGHAETDLAMMGLFGIAYLESILSAYDEASELADGWRQRIRLHQLHPLLTHTVLFGGGYGHEALAVALTFS